MTEISNFANEECQLGNNNPTQKLSSRFGEAKAFLNHQLIASETLVERLLICLLADGHILIEGAPGLAKTRSAKLLAHILGLSFARVQCTPDLMPADVTGTSVWRPDHGRFDFLPGPIFHSLLLVDEINRAPPKVQSALLEAMAEKQVTVAGETRQLPNIFMTIATQNPIEQEGTYPLPEAQLDRFMMHINISLPDRDAERKILDLIEDNETSEFNNKDNVITIEDINIARKDIKNIFLSPAVKDYIIRLVTAPRDPAFAPDLSKQILYPSSPRGTLALTSTSKARAYLNNRDYVLPEDVTALANDVLAHRTILSWRALSEGITSREVIASYLDRVHPS